MAPGALGQHAAPRGSSDHAGLHEVRLDHLLDGVAGFRERRRHGLDANRATAIMLGDMGEIAPVGAVQPQRIHAETRERLCRQWLAEMAGALYPATRREPGEKPVGDSWA